MSENILSKYAFPIDAFIRQLTSCGNKGATAFPYLGCSTTRIWETYLKYAGLSVYGSSIIKTCATARAGVIAGEGLKVSSDDPATNDFLQGFLDSSRFIDHLFDYIITAEIEGAILFNVETNKEDPQFPNVRNYPFVEYWWEVTLDDWGNIVKCVVFANGVVGSFDCLWGSQEVQEHVKTLKDAKPRTLPNPEGLLYNSFLPGTASIFRASTPIQDAIVYAENIDRCLDDIRKSNHQSGYPNMTILCDSPESAKSITEALKISKVKRGETYVLQARDVKYVSSDNGCQPLLDEINKNFETVSGITGVPITRLGQVSLLGTKAGAEEVASTIYTATTNERSTWERVIRRLLEMVIAQHNKDTKDNLSSEKLQVILPFTDLGRVQADVDLKAPYVSKETIRTLLPDIDADQEKQRLEAEGTTEANSLMNAIDTYDSEPNKKDDDDLVPIDIKKQKEAA